MADHGADAVSGLQRLEPDAVLERVGDGFLGVDVLAGAGHGLGYRQMLLVRDGEDDAADRGVREQGVERLVCLHSGLAAERVALFLAAAVAGHDLDPV